MMGLLNKYSRTLCVWCSVQHTKITVQLNQSNNHGLGDLVMIIFMFSIRQLIIENHIIS